MFTLKDEYNLVYNNNFDDFMRDTHGVVEVFNSVGYLDGIKVNSEEELRKLFDRYLVEDERGNIAYSCEGNASVNNKIFKRLNAKYGNDYFKPFATVEDRANALIMCLKVEKEDGTNKIDHPAHYNMHKYEPIDVVEDWELGFNLGNVVKYISRAKYKGHELEDLKKAQWYLNREISRHEQS